MEVREADLLLREASLRVQLKQRNALLEIIGLGYESGVGGSSPRKGSSFVSEEELAKLPIEGRIQVLERQLADKDEALSNMGAEADGVISEPTMPPAHAASHPQPFRHQPQQGPGGGGGGGGGGRGGEGGGGWEAPGGTDNFGLSLISARSSAASSILPSSSATPRPSWLNDVGPNRTSHSPLLNQDDHPVVPLPASASSEITPIETPRSMEDIKIGVTRRRSTAASRSLRRMTGGHEELASKLSVMYHEQQSNARQRRGDSDPDANSGEKTGRDGVGSGGAPDAAADALGAAAGQGARYSSAAISAARDGEGRHRVEGKPLVGRYYESPSNVERAAHRRGVGRDEAPGSGDSVWPKSSVGQAPQFQAPTLPPNNPLKANSVGEASIHEALAPGEGLAGGEGGHATSRRIALVEQENEEMADEDEDEDEGDLGESGGPTRVGFMREMRRKMREEKGMLIDKTPHHVPVRALPGPTTVRGLLAHLKSILGPWQEADGLSEQAREAYGLVKAVDSALEVEGGESGAVKQIIVHAVRREEQLRDAVGLVKVLDEHRKKGERERTELEAELQKLGGLLEREKVKRIGLEERMQEARWGPQKHQLALQIFLPALILTFRLFFLALQAV
jgi:hypothetical protein